MLALTRKVDEAIIIDGNIKIQILDIIDGKVKLGIEAPKDVRIHREELYLEIQKSNEAAIKGDANTLKQLTALLKQN